MAKIRNINISFTNKEEKLARQTAAAPCGFYSVDIQASDEWIIIGKYRDKGLYALELTRVTQVETKE